MESADPPDLRRLLCLGGGRRGNTLNGHGGDDPRPRATDSKPTAHGIPQDRKLTVWIVIVAAPRLPNGLRLTRGDRSRSFGSTRLPRSAVGCSRLLGRHWT